MDKKKLDELIKGREEFRTARKNLDPCWVCQLSESAKGYVKYLVDCVIENGADPDDANEAFDSTVSDLDDLVDNCDDLDEIAAEISEK